MFLACGSITALCLLHMAFSLVSPVCLQISHPLPSLDLWQRTNISPGHQGLYFMSLGFLVPSLVHLCPEGKRLQVVLSIETQAEPKTLLLIPGLSLATSSNKRLIVGLELGCPGNRGKFKWFSSPYPNLIFKSSFFLIL